MRARTNPKRLMPSRKPSTTPARDIPSPIRKQCSLPRSGHLGPSWSGSLSPLSQKHYRLDLGTTKPHGNVAPRQVAEKPSSFTGERLVGFARPPRDSLNTLGSPPSSSPSRRLRDAPSSKVSK